jgi:hypothetical protein
LLEIVGVLVGLLNPPPFLRPVVVGVEAVDELTGLIFLVTFGVSSLYRWIVLLTAVSALKVHLKRQPLLLNVITSEPSNANDLIGSE